jgi:hypothetical protein
MTATVYHRSRADGVVPLLQTLLDAWVRVGTHDIVIAPDGGLRTSVAQQAEKAASGLSNAKTLRQTPHGRGCALDVWPLSFLEFVPLSSGGTAQRWAAWAELPQRVRDEFRAFGEFAERNGFRWGGRFRGKLFPNGDQPHVELMDWQRWPFPP